MVLKVGLSIAQINAVVSSTNGSNVGPLSKGIVVASFTLLSHFPLSNENLYTVFATTTV